ncbi:glycosyltransferase family 2 protein [Amaricoccus solimangrovi]|uniref:Glycosyltransferase family 2 protein n=1 Tax=Amaricoccus solimangrovi TaxID=2589815 RepID=A0A501WSF9_9RHOB|nr:glycosyltransferase family 2 protein [Amaricoccus solimangrovi]TPE52663.1 glycosyltransferase family 2 protein [Amaricoccus solimangrovi]
MAAGLTPLTIRGRSLEDSPGLSLCAIVHDEMFFLPAFLEHYRRLGVARFVILDDASTDGTADFLAEQEDCMVVTSPVRYFEDVGGHRAVHAWRQELMDRFCRDRWAIFADADEFLVPPPGHTLAGVIAGLEAKGSDAIGGIMIDVYPATVGEILADRPFDPDGPWFFDAAPHLLSLPGVTKPVWIYRGARARLFAENGARPNRDAGRMLAAKLGLERFVKANNLGKVPLARWRAGTRWDGSHRIAPAPSTRDMLAILHFKFTADLGRKIGYALETGGYSGGSRQYRQLAELLGEMRERGRGFLGPRSAPVSPEALYRPGLGRWRD